MHCHRTKNLAMRRQRNKQIRPAHLFDPGSCRSIAAGGIQGATRLLGNGWRVDISADGRFVPPEPYQIRPQPDIGRLLGQAKITPLRADEARYIREGAL